MKTDAAVCRTGLSLRRRQETRRARGRAEAWKTNGTVLNCPDDTSA
jgi:hypothetical protein